MDIEKKKKDAKLLIKLADKEDELDVLYEKLVEHIRNESEWLEENVATALRDLMDMEDTASYETGLSLLSDVASEIKHVLNKCEDNYSVFSDAQDLEVEVEELRSEL